MIPPLFYYQLVVWGLLWLCLMLHSPWPSRCATAQQGVADPVPLTFKRTRSHAPTPFAGLPNKPPCLLCEPESAPPKARAPLPPDPLPLTHRPRAIDPSMHCCPHATCPSRGWLGLGTLRANGHPSGGPWRQFHCPAGQGSFLETHGTIFQGKRVVVELIVRVLACGAAGLGIRATARVLEVDPNTVLQWLGEAAEPLEACSQSVLGDVHVRQRQLDELCAGLRAVNNDELGEAEALQRLARSPHWVWTAMDPASTLLVVIDVGDRTLAMAQRVVHRGVPPLAPACAPLLLTDGFKEYTTALLTHGGQWVQPLRRRAQGPAPTPRWMPLPGRLSAHVVKTVRRRRLVQVRHRVGCGTLEAVRQV